MRVLVTALIIIVNFILQSTLFQYIEIMGIQPNIGVIIIVSFAFMRGETTGGIIGFFAGLLQDIFFGMYIGMYALLGLLIGILCGRFFRDYYKENFLIPMFLTVACTFLYEFVFFITNILLRGYTDFGFFLNRIILPEIVYTAFFSMFIYKLLFMINSKIEERERSKRKFF